MFEETQKLGSFKLKLDTNNIREIKLLLPSSFLSLFIIYEGGGCRTEKIGFPCI